jgi:hypothetical protein
MLGLFNVLQAQPVHEQLYVETGGHAWHFSKKPRPPSKSAPKDRPTFAANSAGRVFTPWFPAIPASEYFNRLHRADNQSQS